MYTVPQRRKLRPLRFHIALNDLFLECEDDNLNSDRDDITTHSCAEDVSSIITHLQSIAKKYFRWYENNYMKANPIKSHLLLI